MLWSTEVRKLLQAFLSLLTQPFEQTPADAVRSAATAICISAAFVGIGQNIAMDAVPGGIALVAIWMTVSAVLTKAEHRSLAIARNVSVISFWIAATSALVLFATELLYQDPIDRSPRLYFVVLWLLVLIPVHMFYGLSFVRALITTVALWISTWLFAWGLVWRAGHGPA